MESINRKVVRMNPREIRSLIRRGKLRKPTAGMAPGYVQANLVILPKEEAFDFFVFAQRNPKPCPVLDVTEAGSHIPSFLAPGADVRTDLPLYRIYQKGELTSEVEDITPYWRNDMVAFLLGCSFTFEAALESEGIYLKHIQDGKNVAMYVTNRPCVTAGIFQGPLVVSMRPLPREKLVDAVRITSRYPEFHGAPLHIGNPSDLGIKDISKPDFGSPVTILPNEEPVFWACGVTPQAIALKIKIPLMITHAPGYMFVSDVKESHYLAY